MLQERQLARTIRQHSIYIVDQQMHLRDLDAGTDSLESLLQLLDVVLWCILLERLWQVLDELLGLEDLQDNMLVSYLALRCNIA